MANPGERTVVDRRRFVLGAAGTLAGAGLTTLGLPSLSAAATSRASATGVLPAPNPIPGGLDLDPGPGASIIHVFAPGDPTITLPFTGVPLGGFDVEPATITDFKGSSAVAFHVGTARQ
jgi:hypothetical protein